MLNYSMEWSFLMVRKQTNLFIMGLNLKLMLENRYNQQKRLLEEAILTHLEFIDLLKYV